MCDRGLLCSLALVLAATAATGRAQNVQPGDPLEGPRRAVMIAREAYDTARARFAADSARRMALPVIRRYAGLEVRSDTTNVEPRLLSALDPTFAAALAEARRILGPPADSLLGGVRVTITASYPTADLQRAGGVTSLVVLQYDGAAGRGYDVVSAKPVDTQQLTEHFLMWFGRAAANQLPPVLRKWAPAYAPIRTRDADVNRQAYIRLATYQSTVARACLDGSHFGCRASLAIVPGGDTIGVWFDADARRARVRLHNEQFNRRFPAVRRCLDEASDADCRMFLARIGVPSPTTGQVRQGLIRRALLEGGPAAFTRLVNARGDDVAALLETAAGVPFDSLVSEWRADVLASRSPSPKPSGKEFAISLSICVLAVGFASRRRP